MSAGDSIREILQSLEMRLFEPDVRKSADAVAELLADDFVEITRSGAVLNQQQIIAALAQEVPQRITLSDFRITALAPDVILANYRAVQFDSNEVQSVHTVRTSIWRYSNGWWQMIFHQGTIVAGE